MSCNFMSCNLVRHFHVLQFHALQLGPSFSCPAILCPATWSVIFMSCNFMPCYLVRHFHVLLFHVRLFQRPQIILNDRTCSDVCTVLGLRSPHNRRHLNCRRLFQQLARNTDNCLRYLLPGMRERDSIISNRLRSPTNSHSSLQRLINLKIRLCASDFHITS